MATVSITIPDADLPRAREALCAYIGLTKVADITNANAKAAVAQFVKNQVRAYEADKAARAAEAGLTAPPNIT